MTKMSIDKSCGIWSSVAVRVLDEQPSDDFNPSAPELVRFALRDNYPEMRPVLHDFLRRCDICASAFTAGGGKMPRVQGLKLFDSLDVAAKRGNMMALRLWRQKAKQVHAASRDLLRSEAEASATRTSKDKHQQIRTAPQQEQMECVICQDDVADFAYTPCEHKVACLSCAQQFWQKSHTCPWCRTDVAQPE